MPPRPHRSTRFPAGASVVLAAILALFLIQPAAPAAASLLHLEGPLPPDVGLQPGGLAPCSTPAHCQREDWKVPDPGSALATLLPAVLSLDGVDVVETDADYLHATVTSRIFGFVDDLELHADRKRGVLQARSASRLGDSDLGVNVRRLTRLREALP